MTPPLDELGGALHVGHVEQRVVERPDVGVHLLGERAGQEAQALPRLHHGAREDDAADLLALERGHGHGHGEVGLAGAGRPDAERDGVRADGVHVALLAGGLRTDGTSAIREQDVFAQGGAARTRRWSEDRWRGARSPSVGSPRASATLMRSENRAVSDCTSVGSPSRTMVSPRTVMRAENASWTRWSSSSAWSHDERHVHALGRRQSDLRLVCHAAIVPRGMPSRCDVTEPTRADAGTRQAHVARGLQGRRRRAATCPTDVLRAGRASGFAVGRPALTRGRTRGTPWPARRRSPPARRAPTARPRRGR